MRIFPWDQGKLIEKRRVYDRTEVKHRKDGAIHG